MTVGALSAGADGGARGALVCRNVAVSENTTQGFYLISSQFFCFCVEQSVGGRAASPPLFFLAFPCLQARPGGLCGVDTQAKGAEEKSYPAVFWWPNCFKVSIYLRRVGRGGEICTLLGVGMACRERGRTARFCFRFLAFGGALVVHGFAYILLFCVRFISPR